MKVSADTHPDLDDWYVVSFTASPAEAALGVEDDTRFVVRLLSVNGGHEYVYDATGRAVSAEVRAACEDAERRRVA